MALADVLHHAEVFVSEWTRVSPRYNTNIPQERPEYKRNISGLSQPHVSAAPQNTKLFSCFQCVTGHKA